MDLVFVKHMWGKRKEGFNQGFINNPRLHHVVGLVVSIYAAYMSYKCSVQQEKPPMKTFLYAFGAFIFGGLYIFLRVGCSFMSCSAKEPA